MALHFVGFRDGTEVYRAMQVFGIPDFVHIAADARFVYGGELDPDSDIIVFAKGAKVSSLQEARDLVDCGKMKHTIDDSGNFHCHYRKMNGQVPW